MPAPSPNMLPVAPSSGNLLTPGIFSVPGVGELPGYVGERTVQDREPGRVGRAARVAARAAAGSVVAFGDTMSPSKTRRRIRELKNPQEMAGSIAAEHSQISDHLQVDDPLQPAEHIELDAAEEKVLASRFDRVDQATEKKALATGGRMTNAELDESMLKLGYGKTAKSAVRGVSSADAHMYLKSDPDSRVIPESARESLKKEVEGYKSLFGSAMSPETRKKALESVPSELWDLMPTDVAPGTSRNRREKLKALVKPETDEDRERRRKLAKVAAVTGVVVVGATVAYYNREKIAKVVNEHVDADKIRDFAKSTTKSARAKGSAATARAKKHIETVKAGERTGKVYKKAASLGRTAIASAMPALEAGRARVSKVKDRLASGEKDKAEAEELGVTAPEADTPNDVSKETGRLKSALLSKVARRLPQKSEEEKAEDLSSRVVESPAEASGTESPKAKISGIRAKATQLRKRATIRKK